MKLLLDTNIFLEILLEQERAEEAKSLLRRVRDHEFYLTDYSLHSIGLALFRRMKQDAFRQFAREILIDVGIGVLSLYPEEMSKIADASLEFDLDFDDAYQFAIATKHDLKIVSLDSDFDKTPRGRFTPAQILNEG
jgi:predicted nucleic acid-binding protein